VAMTKMTPAAIRAAFPHHAVLGSAWINFWRNIGGFCVVFFENQWVKRSGTALVFGVQAALIAAGVILVIATQISGGNWRLKYSSPAMAKKMF